MSKNQNIIRVVELFAGVGGFRIGLEGASDAYETIWNNQWEPSTQHQDASLVYQARFGSKGHCNKDINTVATTDIPDHDLLVGGFPCQDYSVAATLSRSGGIEGKKGVLWWQIYRILNEKGDKRPKFIFFEMPVNYKLTHLKMYDQIREAVRNDFPEDKYDYLPSDTSKYMTTDGQHLDFEGQQRYTHFFKRATAKYMNL